MEAHECAGDFSYRIEESADGNFSLDYGHFGRMVSGKSGGDGGAVDRLLPADAQERLNNQPGRRQ